MSRKFHAVNRKTGQRWSVQDWLNRKGVAKPAHAYIVMYDSGYLAVVEEHDCYGGVSIQPLDPSEWETVVSPSISRVPADYVASSKKTTRPTGRDA